MLMMTCVAWGCSVLGELDWAAVCLLVGTDMYPLVARCSVSVSSIELLVY